MRNLSTAFLGYYEKRFLGKDEVSRDYNHNGKGFDMVTFAAPVDFFWTKAPLGVVVKVSINGRGDKSFYIHEICDAEDNYIQMAGENSSKKTSSTNFVEPTSTVSAADGISPKTSIRNESDIIKNESAEAMDIVVDSDTESVDRLQELFTEALVEASENFQSAEKNTTEDGGVKYSLNYDDAIDQLHAGTLDRTKNTHLKVLDNTPQVYIDKADAKDLKIIMGWDIAYLAMNKSGDLLGNYHGLGPDVMKAIPQALQDPLYIVKQDNGRIIAVTEIVVKGNRSTLVSIELGAFKSTTQDGENESDNYNLIVTIFDAKSNYLAKLMNNGEIVHNKNNEDPAHFILRLKSLNKALSDDDHAKSSNKDIAQDKVEVKNESAEAVGVEVDEKTESVAPEILMSERTWTESDYVQERENSDRSDDSVSNRSLLANALETAAQNEDEKQKLYQREIELMARKREAESNPELLQTMDNYSDLFTEMRALRSQKRQGTATQAELDRIAEIKELREKGITITVNTPRHLLQRCSIVAGCLFSYTRTNVGKFMGKHYFYYENSNITQPKTL